MKMYVPLRSLSLCGMETCTNENIASITPTLLGIALFPESTF